MQVLCKGLSQTVRERLQQDGAKVVVVLFKTCDLRLDAGALILKGGSELVVVRGKSGKTQTSQSGFWQRNEAIQRPQPEMPPLGEPTKPLVVGQRASQIPTGTFARLDFRFC